MASGIISGATSTKLTISNVQTNNGGILPGYRHKYRRIGDQFQSPVLTVLCVASDHSATNPTKAMAVGSNCVLYSHRHRNGAVELPMVGERDEPGEEWSNKWSTISGATTTIS